MTDFINTNPHWVYVDNGSRNVGVAPGRVVYNVDDDSVFAKNLSNTNGVEEASKKQGDEFKASLAGHDTSPTEAQKAEKLFGDLRAEADLLAVAVPLQRVVGDDDAPHGPPSGTITSKQALVRQNPEEKPHFMDHQNLPEDLGGGRKGVEAGASSEVEQEQAERQSKVAELFEETIGSKNVEKPKSQSKPRKKPGPKPKTKPESQPQPESKSETK